MKIPLTKQLTILLEGTYIPFRYSSVDLSAPTILRSRVRIPSTPSMLFIVICTIFVIYRTKINKKRSCLAHFLKKIIHDLTLCQFQVLLCSEFRQSFVTFCWCIWKKELTYRKRSKKNNNLSQIFTHLSVFKSWRIL